MKIKNQSQRLLLFLIFSTLYNKIKMKSFGLKTLLKTCIKTLIKVGNFALEILIENNKEMGYLYPHFKSARWQLKRANLPFRL